jgi:CelD/BcsL family acetyltransferase involved in cellulose biosynthesis
VIEQVDPATDARWDDWLRHFPAASCFHSSAWARVLQGAYGHRTMGFVLKTGDEIQGMVPCGHANSRWLGRRVACMPFADFARPLVDDPSAYQELEAAILERGRASGWTLLEIRGGRDCVPDTPPSVVFWEHDLDLSPGKNVLLANCTDATRRNIRKAERSGLRIELSDSPEAVQRYYDLHCVTRRRLGSPPQPKQFFDSIWAHFIKPGNGIVGLAWHGTIPVAGVVVLRHATQSIYKFGAADERYQHLRPSNLVMWAAIQHSVGLGMKNFHFGRTSFHQEGLRHFKKGWGSREGRLEYFCLDVKTGRSVSKPDRAGRWPSRLICRMPVPVVRKMGEVLYRHLV